MTKKATFKRTDLTRQHMLYHYFYLFELAKRLYCILTILSFLIKYKVVQLSGSFVLLGQRNKTCHGGACNAVFVGKKKKKKNKEKRKKKVLSAPNDSQQGPLTPKL